MKLHELTREQQTFAEDNHNLIYTFLRAKRLRPDDYYDVIVFGYLRAVQKYLLREDLRSQYEFSTIAWRAMECDLGKHYKAQSRPMRRAVTVSLESMFNKSEWLMMADVIPDSDRLTDRLEAELLWDEIAMQLTDEQIEIIRMRANGYNNREIAASKKRRQSDVDNMLSEIRTALLSMCLA